MNVLILVLSARREPWGALMDTSMVTWDSVDHPKTQTLYYCGKSDQPSTDKVFYSPTYTEDLEDVSSRTIEAFEESLKYDWDYLARPNSSCYVHKQNLVDYLRTSIWGNVIFGILTGGENSFLWGGCQFILSRDVVERMVAAKDKWNHNVMDDNSITELAKFLNVDIREGWCSSINANDDGSYTVISYGHGEGFVFRDWEDVKKLDGHYFVRCKHDPDRTQDLVRFRKLHEYWK